MLRLRLAQANAVVVGLTCGGACCVWSLEETPLCHSCCLASLDFFKPMIWRPSDDAPSQSGSGSRLACKTASGTPPATRSAVCLLQASDNGLRMQGHAADSDGGLPPLLQLVLPPRLCQHCAQLRSPRPEGPAHGSRHRHRAERRNCELEYAADVDGAVVVAPVGGQIAAQRAKSIAAAPWIEAANRTPPRGKQPPIDSSRPMRRTNGSLQSHAAPDAQPTARDIDALSSTV